MYSYYFSFLKIKQMGLGKKQVEAVSAFIPSIVIWGIGAAITGIYFTDWKIIATKIPFYNGKFEQYFEKLRKDAESAKK